MVKHSKPAKNFLRPRHSGRSIDFGRLVAEEDPNLLEYYIDPGRYVARAESFSDPKVFFVGPKGVGKSAILQMIRLRHPADSARIITISPDDLAFSALANVEVNTPILSDLGKHQWLFKSLWDYVLALEILKREFPSRTALGSFFTSLFRGKYEVEARRLLEISAVEGGAPQSLSSRILQLIEEVELAGEFQGAKVSGKAKVDANRGKAGHLHLLNLVNSVATNVGNELSHPYYVLIDDLDLHWTDTPTQNAFIAAMFLSLRAHSTTR